MLRKGLKLPLTFATQFFKIHLSVKIMKIIKFKMRGYDTNDFEYRFSHRLDY